MDTREEKNIEKKEKKYFEMNAMAHTKNRIVWLIILCISSLFTGMIISCFEDAFLAIPILVSFIPMLMGTGGNCGSQVATIVIRDLATGSIETKDYLKIILKESLIALLTGFALGVLNFFIVWWRCGDVFVSIVVILTLLFIVFISNILGGILPLIVKKCRLDPALMVSPIITSLLDCLSIISYFLIAKFILYL